MFERYTEKARRVIFFARYEASQFGSPYIETEHLLLGLLREDKALTRRFLPRKLPVESIRQQIETATTKREHISTSVDLPLSNEGKRALAYAAEEADRLSHKHIGTEHLLLGLLREEKCFAAQLLHEHGVRLSAVREQLAQAPHQPEGVVSSPGTSVSAPLAADITQQALDGVLRPFIGREKELESLERVLCRASKNNAVLVGEPGVGKRAIVEGLAQRIADSKVPALLALRTILELDVVSTLRRTRGGQVSMAGSNNILFMDELYSLLAASPTAEMSEMLKMALVGRRIQCICSATPEEYRKARERHRWLERCFRPIHVPPMTEAETVAVLLSVQDRLETFHSRSYTDEAISLAARYAGVYIKDRHLPDSALDLMDEAAAYVNARSLNWPEEIAETMKRIKLIVQRLENAIANHEFQKAQLYSSEEKKERENLRDLRKKHHIEEPATSQVTREDVEEVLSRWTGIPVSTIRQGSAAAGTEPSEK